MAMESSSRKHITWGAVRRIYLFAGILAALGAAASVFWAVPISPYLLGVASVLVLCVALAASDELFNQVHRAFWHRGRPK